MQDSENETLPSRGWRVRFSPDDYGWFKRRQLSLGKFHTNSKKPFPPGNSRTIGHEFPLALPAVIPQQLKNALFVPGDDPAACLSKGFHVVCSRDVFVPVVS